MKPNSQITPEKEILPLHTLILLMTASNEQKRSVGKKVEKTGSLLDMDEDDGCVNQHKLIRKQDDFQEQRKTYIQREILFSYSQARVCHLL